MSRPFFAHLARRYEPPSALDRRQFLKLTLAASAGLLISGSAGSLKGCDADTGPSGLPMPSARASV